MRWNIQRFRPTDVVQTDFAENDVAEASQPAIHTTNDGGEVTEEQLLADRGEIVAGHRRFLRSVCAKPKTDADEDLDDDSKGTEYRRMKNN